MIDKKKDETLITSLCTSLNLHDVLPTILLLTCLLRASFSQFLIGTNFNTYDGLKMNFLSLLAKIFFPMEDDAV